jgi:predicted transcriptional regulator YheO
VRTILERAEAVCPNGCGLIALHAHRETAERELRALVEEIAESVDASWQPSVGINAQAVKILTRQIRERFLGPQTPEEIVSKVLTDRELKGWPKSSEIVQALRQAGMLKEPAATEAG